MLIIPAIDLLDGKVVRLTEGKRESATIYSSDPAAVAKGFVDQGATRLHVVDLDGAFAPQQENRQAFHQILGQIIATGVPVQVGGGLRSFEACKATIDAGATFIVLGSAVLKDPDLFERACEALPVIAAVDARDDKVAISGWTEQTKADAFLVAREAIEVFGARAVLYTDITRDGTGQGPNVERSSEFARALAPTELIASGGIGTLDHLRALAAGGVPACVVGRALYEEKFTLKEAIEAMK
jgi:phosphoribosylformimino-5-aminoimidazole carboxamide ribotide isomerase